MEVCRQGLAKRIPVNRDLRMEEQGAADPSTMDPILGEAATTEAGTTTSHPACIKWE
jgi:hypothetical protein